ncbi:hypothetical protein H0B56_20265 [Haloechinothrix sp. YIM 98757]|uniref:LPXTG-motif cell wall anchor domain-containing protein n=1 Tax=Haloechinothrix aidingensis TaxID=2752311 RepID=A0A838AFG7_9PSEU|nr:hypothetical protein [Haloechinothrix aidingensis]MBA0127887.1 hypothetical protein [Haloechinothrix aidingensis]
MVATTTAAALSAAMMLGASAAHATSDEDARADIGGGNAKTCADVGLGGELIAVHDGEDDDLSNVEYDDGETDDQYLTITSVAASVSDVTGIVVKGGDGYNVYEPGERELSGTAPWEDLRAPLNKGGKIPEISHWFVCGELDDSTPTPTHSDTPEPSETETTTSETSEPPETTTSSETTESDTPGSSTPVSSTSTTDESTTTESEDEEQDDVTPAGASGPLADTGFGAGSLIWVGALLLIGGGAALYLARTRLNS